MIIVAAAVVASEAPAVASFFEKSMCESLLCRRQLGTLQVLFLQSFDRWPGLRQLKHSLNFCICSRRSFCFIDLDFSQLEIACCLSLNGHSEFIGFVESSALDAKVLDLVSRGFENYFCQTTSLSVLTSSHELLLRSQATL